MITQKVAEICSKYGYIHCDRCPLEKTCSIPLPDLPGNTLKEKTAWWENAMNEAADKIDANGEQNLNLEE